MDEKTRKSAWRDPDVARQNLLAMSDIRMAGELAGPLSDLINNQLNAMEIGAGTSLVARALVARAIMGVSALWWNDLMPELPVPITTAALRSIMDDPPPELTTHCFIDPSIQDDENGRTSH